MSAQRTIKWDVLRWMGLAALLVVCGVLLARPGGLAAAQPIKMPTFASPVAQIGSNSTSGYTDVTLKNVQGLYGAHLKATFDKSKYQVASIEVPAGSVFASPAVVGVKTYNNTTGEIEFVAVRENPQPAYDNMTSVAGVLFRVNWVQGPGCVKVADHVPVGPPAPPQLSDRNGMDISYTVIPDLSCVGCQPKGKVLLQGHTDSTGQRPDYSGTDIMLSTERPCPAPNAVQAMWSWPGVIMTKTAADGSFSLDSNKKTCRCLVAFKHGYLTAQHAGTAGSTLLEWPATLPTITLLGGDATEDDYINIFDLALIASHYGESHPANPDAAVADINGDSKVDIYDLAITAGNSGVARGPQPW